MPGFDAIYRQIVTVFNRKEEYGETIWHPSVIYGVHLIIDRSIIVSTYGEQASDNAKLHIRYTPSSEGAKILTGAGRKIYLPPKEFAAMGNPAENITFAFGDNFDFIFDGEYSELVPIADDDYKSGFFNYMNKTYDNVFAITNCSKFNLIPHFEIVAR